VWAAFVLMRRVGRSGDDSATLALLCRALRRRTRAPAFIKYRPRCHGNAHAALPQQQQAAGVVFAFIRRQRKRKLIVNEK